MPLFKILPGEKVENVKRVHFNKEKELQELVELNMSKFFGIEFLETEYPIPNGRIDSLCIDESQTPVIIEYKKHKDLSAIIQGLFYIDWLKVKMESCKNLPSFSVEEKKHILFHLNQAVGFEKL